MSSVAIVYFSGYGHTAKQAEAVQRGAAGTAGASRVEATLYRIDADGNLPEGTLEQISAAGAIIYGSPTYMGAPAWQFKKFADFSSKAWFGQAWKNKVAAGFTNSASPAGDKYATLQYFWTLSQQHGQIWLGGGLMPASKKANTRADLNWTGVFAGAVATSPEDATADEAPTAPDLEVARLLGQRVAELVLKLA